MNHNDIIDKVTYEVMNILKGINLTLSYDTNLSGKVISLIIPNIDINLSHLEKFLKAISKNNTIKVFLPKWSKYLDTKIFSDIKAEIINIEHTNISNSSLISGNILILIVNNENFLRKLSKLEKSNAFLNAIVNALANNTEVYVTSSFDYKISDYIKKELEKVKIKVVNSNDLGKSFLYQTDSNIKTYQNIYSERKYTQDTVNCYNCTTYDCINKCLSKVDAIINSGADRVSPNILDKIPLDIAHLIDHTLLKPDATEEQIRKLCKEALEFGFASVCVNPSFVPLAHSILKGSKVKVCTVIGFPLGSTTTETKVFETKQAIQNGADEIDMVINVGALKSKDYDYVYNDIKEVVKACNGKILKVILETALLNDEEKIKACELSVKAGADFVKTSTGFGPGGATEEDVRLMRYIVGKDLGVKASGGIRDTITTLKMLKAGANRIGASASVAIVKNQAGDKKSNY
ncbi:MAG: hypothetical protein KatS3mg068_0052 [Candidatus Sericytochromatia bacterium]|nr:MAG: hypothetical protein KatS3mg068_0052 [Candidatus Sericytochromatia bacterium]